MLSPKLIGSIWLVFAVVFGVLAYIHYGLAGSASPEFSLHGFKETKASIANKLARGTFSATFFLASLAAIECMVINLENI